MSKGPGAIERRIAGLLAATRDQALSVGEIADHAFELGGRAPSRSQRLSATRAAHRLLQRVREADEDRIRLLREAHQRIEITLGRKRRDPDGEFDGLLHKDPLYRRADRLWPIATRLGWGGFIDIGAIVYGRGRTDWRATTDKTGRLFFRPAPPQPQTALAEAIELLGVPADYTYETVIAAFHREAKKADAEQRRRLLDASGRLLGSLSLSSSTLAAQAPRHALIGMKTIYYPPRARSGRMIKTVRREISPELIERIRKTVRRD